MAKLRLLGGQAEEIQCVVIESDEAFRNRVRRATDLQRLARRAHNAWLMDPESVILKGRYADALKRYGEYVERQDLVDHAFKLANGLA